jgi:serine/threonine protein kinase
VRQQCSGDEELRRRVESLIECDEGPSLLDDPGPEHPQEFGRYRIVSKLGEGGMGIVYLARDTQLNREVALKTVAPVLALSEEQRQRFLQEVRSASLVNHPNIVPIYDFGQKEGIAYYVMAYVRGKPLDRLIPLTGLKIEEALTYAIPVAGALNAAHCAGIIHRDVKPANVIVDEQGSPKLLDFGIAKLVSERAGASTVTGTETVDGTLVGTIAYMSPEQAEGRPVDARSDIFSFGSLLYEMVTGRRAFAGTSSLSTLTAILRDEPKRADSVIKGLPRELCTLLERCHRKDPALRYQSMADVLTDLGRIPISQSARIRHAFGRGWTIAAASLLILTSALFWWFARAGHVSPPQATPKPIPTATYDTPRVIPLTSYLGEEASPSFSPDGNQIAFSFRQTGDGPSNIFIKLVGQNDAILVSRGAATDLAPVWSPDGRWIAFLRYSGPRALGFPVGKGYALIMIPAIGGAERKVLEFDSEDEPDRLAWHPGGKWISVARHHPMCNCGTIHIISVTDGTDRELTAPERGTFDASPAFDPDGKRLVFTRIAENADQDLYLLELNADLTARAAPRRLTFDNVYATEPVWMPDGHSVLYSRGSLHSPGLWRLSVDPGSSELIGPHQVAVAGVGVRSPAVSKTGRLVFAVSIMDADIWRVHLKAAPGERLGSEPDFKLIASTRLEHDVKLSPDGRKLSFASERSGFHEIWVADADGKNAMQLTSFEGPYTGDAHWSPDAQWISFSSQAGGNWAIYVIPAQGGAMKQITDPRLRATGGSWTLDGRWIYCHIAGQLWKVPAAGGSPVQITRAGGSVPAESPDGRTVYYMKEDAPLTSLWAVPAGGGVERQILPAIFSHNVVPRREGIYFIPGPEKPAVWFFDFGAQKMSKLASIKAPPAYGMDVSKDGRVAVVPVYTDTGGDIMMIPNFH